MAKCDVILVVIAALVLGSDLCQSTTTEPGAEAARVQELMRLADTTVRPSNLTGGPLQVRIGYNLLNIGKMDTETGYLETNGYLTLRWTDSRLAGPEDDPKVRIDVANIWTPDIELYNVQGPGMRILNRRMLALVYSSGEVFWVPMVSIRSSCFMGNTSTPFTCALKFGSWTYDGDNLDLQPEDGSGLTDYHVSPRVSNVSMTSVRRVSYYSCCSEPYPSVDVNIELQTRD